MKIVLVIPIASTILLAGCGGGGGGGGTGAALNVAVPFTSMAASPRPGTTELSGLTVETSYTSNTTTYMVESVAPPQIATGKLTRTTDNAGKMTSGSIAGTLSSISGATDPSNPGVVALANANPTNFYLLTDETNFNYQSFGIWQTGRNTGSGFAGALSAGAPTAAAAIPTSGAATFNGNVLGAALDASGENYTVAGLAQLDANFGSRTITLTTNSNTKVSMVTGLPTSAPELNLSSTMTYA